MIDWPDGVVALPEELLSRHTAWRTGGPTPWFLVVHRRHALAPLLALLKASSLSLTVLGAGTHTAVRDGGLAHVVVKLGTDFSKIELLDDGSILVGASVPAPALAWWAAGRGLAGAEHLARAPGSVGGCIVDGIVADGVIDVELPLRGRLQRVPLVRGAKAKLVTGVRLALRPEGREAVTKRTRASLKGSRALPSWYAKPKRGSAHSELRKVEMDGVRLRGCVVPAASPEMVVNLGGGTAQDLSLLHKSALDRVHKLRGVKLTSTARWTGRRA